MRELEKKMEPQTRILVVDDEKFIRDLICRLLMDIGYKSLIEAEDGQEALRTLMTHKSNIGLVILDIEMPKVSGVEFLRLVRTNPSSPNKNVPVVMLTGHSNMESLMEVAKFGIHGFLTKPVSKSNLEKQIKRAMTSPPLDPAKILGTK